MRAGLIALAACGSLAAVVADAPSPDAAPTDAFALVTGRAHAIDLRNDPQHVPMALSVTTAHFVSAAPDCTTLTAAHSTMIQFDPHVAVDPALLAANTPYLVAEVAN